MTENKYWVFFEQLRRSGVVNMFGAGPYLAVAFDLSEKEAKGILIDWMNNYSADDYNGM